MVKSFQTAWIGTILRTCLILTCAVSAQSEEHRLQICASMCNLSFCQRLAEDIEFDLELSKNFLLPPCAKVSRPLQENEFRLVLSKTNEKKPVRIELFCGAVGKCLSGQYQETNDVATLATSIAKDIRIAIANSLKQKPAPVSEIRKITPKPVAVKMIKEEIAPVLPAITPVEPPVSSMNVPAITETVSEVSGHKVVSKFGHVTMSFGAGTWNYFFESNEQSEKIPPVYSRVFPRAVFSSAIWPTSFLRLSLNAAGSTLGFRLRANQPVEGDGQIIGAQTFHADLIVALMYPLFGFLHLGGEVGYEYDAALVDPHRLDDRSVTVVPGYQSHLLRIGPRIVIGALSDKGVIDIGAGFYPYAYYFETPDEPAASKKIFAWSVDGTIRMMLTAEIFADALMKISAFHIRYESEAQRETVEGDKLGPGEVVNASASATLGLGWLF